MTTYAESTLNMVVEGIKPFLVCSKEDIDLLVLWASHSFCYTSFHASPRLSVRSTLPGSGKSTVLDIVKCLSCRGEKASYSTGASIYTLIDQEHPTILIDEADQLFGTNGFSKAGTILQSILNDGYTRDGTVRVMRSGNSVKLSIYGPVAFGGLGKLPAAMSTRSIPMMLKPGTPECVFDPSLEGEILRDVMDPVAKWIRRDEIAKALSKADPRPPIEGIDNPRVLQIMAPLVAIAEAVGGSWPARASAVAKHAFLGRTEEVLLSRQEMALRDALTVWTPDTEYMTGEALVVKMATMSQSTWSKVFAPGNRASVRYLGTLLGQMGIVSKNKREGDSVFKAYFHKDLVDAVPSTTLLPDVAGDEESSGAFEM